MNGILHTNGAGFWSAVPREIRIVGCSLGYVNDDEDFGELRVYFDPEDWDVTSDGLIYTDPQFLKELKSYLYSHQLNGQDVEYSEQGMQGDDYVSLDVGAEFLKSWQRQFNNLETTV